jgi:hypothetical protein
MSYGGPISTLRQKVVTKGNDFGLKAILSNARKLREEGKSKAVISTLSRIWLGFAATNLACSHWVGQWHMLPGANLARMSASQGWDFILINTVSRWFVYRHCIGLNRYALSVR